MRIPLRFIFCCLFILCFAYIARAQTFVQQGDKLVASGIGTNQWQGSTVALSSDGNIAVVGASEDNNDQGAAYVYRRTGAVWSQPFKLPIHTSPYPNTPYVGVAVAINTDGSTIAVGGHYDNINGSVWIFTWVGNTWVQQAQIKGSLYPKHLGNALRFSEDGNTLIIGNLQDNSCEVWVRAGTTWSKEALLRPDDGILEPYFGGELSLSADGNTAIIGALGENNGTGAALVFTRSASVWTLQQVLTSAGTSFFGGSVSLSADGNSALIGAYEENAVHFFTRNGNVWTEQGDKLVPRDASGRPLFGIAVSLSADGKTALIGGAMDATAVGAAWIFKYTGGKWQQQGSKLVGKDVTEYANFGINVELSSNGKTAIIGGPGDVNYRGAVWIYELTITPVITVGAATGTIAACVGTVSEAPAIQQVKVSGNNLTAGIKVDAPENFEISTSAAFGYTTSLTLAQAAGTVDNTTIYIRAAATAPAGPISGNILLSSGAESRVVAVNGTVNAASVLTQLNNKAYNAGDITDPINFSVTNGGTVNWTNDNPQIGLPAGNTGNIASFTATNSTAATITAKITATPVNTNGCTGLPVTFTITVAPKPVKSISVSGTLPQLSTIYGNPSSAAAFTVSGTGLSSGITITSPNGFEASTDNVNFSKSVVTGTNGSAGPISIYIRLAAGTHAGAYSGTIMLSSDEVINNNLSTAAGNTVSPASLIFTADNKSKTAGAPNPVLTFNYTGFVNGEDLSVLTAPPELSTTANLTSVAGQYPISISNAVSPDYKFSYINGTLLVLAGQGGITVSNTFTPNGDGFNDTWSIRNIVNYPNCVVDVFNRQGTGLFHSIAYNIPWDGKYIGRNVPAGTYYYIIDLKDGSQPTTGWVAIIR